MSSLFHDARYGWRVLKREPGFALVAMLTIALGVGATTTLFSVANGVLLKPLPWADSERLVRLTETRQGKPARIRGTITNGTFLAWYKDSAVLDGIGAYSTNMVTAASGDGEPGRVQVGNVTASMFVVGLGTALATARVLSSFLYGVTAYDATSFVAVAIVLAAVVALACIVPARRAARVDPLTALRSN